MVKWANNDVFHTPRSKKWVEQIHFLVEAKKSRKLFRAINYLVVLDPKEHQSFMWASRKLDTVTEASNNHFEEAVTKFRENFPCPNWQKPLAFFKEYI
jgi:hypothetical protein